MVYTCQCRIIFPLSQFHLHGYVVYVHMRARSRIHVWIYRNSHCLRRFLFRLKANKRPALVVFSCINLHLHRYSSAYATCMAYGVCVCLHNVLARYRIQYNHTHISYTSSNGSSGCEEQAKAHCAVVRCACVCACVKPLTYADVHWIFDTHNYTVAWNTFRIWNRVCYVRKSWECVGVGVNISCIDCCCELLSGVVVKWKWIMIEWEWAHATKLCQHELFESKHLLKYNFNSNAIHCMCFAICTQIRPHAFMQIEFNNWFHKH